MQDFMVTGLFAGQHNTKLHGTITGVILFFCSTFPPSSWDQTNTIMLQEIEQQNWVAEIGEQKTQGLGGGQERGVNGNYMLGRSCGPTCKIVFSEKLFLECLCLMTNKLSWETELSKTIN